MTKNLKIAFFGTSDKSLPILTKLAENFNLSLCVTKSDTVVGRKKEKRETAVKKWAHVNNVNCILVDTLKGDQLANVIDSLLDSSIDLCVVSDFSFIIPTDIIRTPKYGLLNVHFSLLPKYRGASPVQHAILNGDKITGVTYMLMNEGMDTGDILFQFEHKLTGKETTKDLLDVLFEKAAQNLPDVIEKYISGELKAVSQDHTKATYCYSPSHPKNTFIYKEDAVINWNESDEIIDRKIRAFFPWPIAWTTLNDLHEHKIIKLKDPNKKNLKAKIYESELDGGLLKIKKIQVEGGKIISWDEFLNGYAQKV